MFFFIFPALNQRILNFEKQTIHLKLVGVIILMKPNALALNWHLFPQTALLLSRLPPAAHAIDAGPGLG